MALLALCVVAPRAACAELTLTLTNPIQNAPANSSLIFAGTLINTGAESVSLTNVTLNLFGDAVNFLVGDETLFLENAPPFLAANGGTYTGNLFGVTVSADAPEGGYFGLATIQGGPNAGDSDDLATRQFQIIVTPVAAAPEPATFGYEILCIGCWVLAKRRRIL